jgi:hypothetical protein
VYAAIREAVVLPERDVRRCGDVIPQRRTKDCCARRRGVMSNATKSKTDYRKKRTLIAKGLLKPREYTMNLQQALKAAGL